VAELAPRWLAYRESALRERRGRERLRAQGAGRRAELVFTDRVLVTLTVLRLQVPHAALAAMFGVDRSTVTRAVREVRPLLAGRGYATPAGPRLHTLADVFAYAAAHGIRLRADGSEVQVRRPKVGRPGRRAFVSGKKRQNTLKFTKISDGDGRTLWDGAIRPGRMHDQTAVQTEGIDALLSQFPDVQFEMDSGYGGLRRDHPAQVSIPPRKPAKDAPPKTLRPGSRPATPSPRHASAPGTPSPTARTGGLCSAGSGGAATCPQLSWPSAHWSPTGPPPGKPDPIVTPAQDAPNLNAHHIVSPRTRTISPPWGSR
jgi:Helix-turn-helix of DDE superfamily endonuclease/DDE superfamily endonuclease